MTIDLSKCVRDQKVVTRKGNIGIFTGCSDDPGPWPYEVSFNVIIVGYTREGYLLDKFDIRGKDIVEVLPLDWPAPKLTSPSLLELLQEIDALKSQISAWETELRNCVSDEYKTCLPPLNAICAQISALRKENEILKAQLAGKLKSAEDKVSEWHYGFPPFGKTVLVEFQGEEIEVIYDHGVQPSWVALNYFKTEWHPNAFNRWKYPAK